MNYTLLLVVVAAVLAMLFVLIIRRVLRKKGAQQGQGGYSSADQAQLYIGNLSYRVHERDLRRCFEKYGVISYLKVVKDRDTGRSKGFGFVTFEKPEEAEKALAVHGESLFGRNLVVRFAKPR